jgi:hypothetical protein
MMMTTTVMLTMMSTMMTVMITSHPTKRPAMPRQVQEGPPGALPRGDQVPDDHLQSAARAAPLPPAHAPQEWRRRAEL